MIQVFRMGGRRSAGFAWIPVARRVERRSGAHPGEGFPTLQTSPQRLTFRREALVPLQELQTEVLQRLKSSES